MDRHAFATRKHSLTDPELHIFESTNWENIKKSYDAVEKVCR